MGGAHPRAPRGTPRGTGVDFTSIFSDFMVPLGRARGSIFDTLRFVVSMFFQMPPWEAFLRIWAPFGERLDDFGVPFWGSVGIVKNVTPLAR